MAQDEATPKAFAVREIADAHAASDALSYLRALAGDDPLTSTIDVVDEDERARLSELATNGRITDPAWIPLLVSDAASIVAYAGIIDVPPDATPAGVMAADVAVTDGGTDALRHLLLEVSERAGRRRRDEAHVWLRRAGDRECDVAAEAGFGLVRRLSILGLDLAANTAAHSDAHADADDGEMRDLVVRAYVPDADDGCVADLLASAYAGTADGGWDVARLQERARAPWFRAEDLLLAEDLSSGALVGLCWTKRRSAAVGELYNLAVHPRGHGEGIGTQLLARGIAHLRDAGCRHLLLWVDAANAPALRLYTSAGFRPVWDDAFVVRTMRTPQAT